MNLTKIVLLFIACTASISNAITLSAQDVHLIGQKIWNNEGSCEINKLTWWNGNEPFPSVGIGHFIWYPKGYNDRFVESFPELLAFIAQHGIKIPSFLAHQKKPHCPWKTRTEFYAAFNGKHMKELRQFLFDTIDLQTKFIIQRLEKALPYMLKNLPATQRAHVKKQFYRMASSAMGLYALIDYTNFKGEGVSPKEVYHGQGWGLLQVLQKMKGEGKGPAAINEFSTAALSVLIKRILNSPAGSGEERWLPGWKNRVNSYMLPFTKPNKNSCI